MMSLTASPGIWHKITAMLTLPANMAATNPIPEHSDGERKAEQDVLNDMLWSNPGAISSELGAFYMMSMCGGRR